MNKYLRKQNGITIASVIVTVIIMLIMAGTAISEFQAQQSIIEQAMYATDETYRAQEEERNTLGFKDDKVTQENNPTLSLFGTIPEGGIYFTGVTTTTVGDYTGYTSMYTQNQNFPDTVTNGDVFVYQDYEYRYNMYGNWHNDPSIEGWGFVAIDKNKSSYTEILNDINGQPVTDGRSAFRNCNNFMISPALPVNIKNIDLAYESCANLTTAPYLPNSVISMKNTFANCSNLIEYLNSSAGTPLGDFSGYKLPDNITSLYWTFKGCTFMTKAPVIPEKVTNLQNTFNGCNSLEGTFSIPCTITDDILVNTIDKTKVTITRYHTFTCTGTCGF